jgi:hypothetical protein
MSLRLSAEEDLSDDESFNGVDWLKEVEAAIPLDRRVWIVLSKNIGSSMPARCATPSPPIYAREEFVSSQHLGRPRFRRFGGFGKIPGRCTYY